MNKHFWIALVALNVSTVSWLACANESNYAPPVEQHAPQPSSAAVAHKATRAADRKLSHSVRKAIESGGAVDMARVSVLAKAGAITLTGSVPEQSQSELAQQRAESVAGVTAVTNRLSIDEPGGGK